MNSSGGIRVTVCFAATDASRCDEQAFEINAGATIDDALKLANVAAQTRDRSVGVWGRTKSRDTVLREGDRIEMYAPLKADPKAARRRRASGRASRKM